MTDVHFASNGGCIILLFLLPAYISISLHVYVFLSFSPLASSRVISFADHLRVCRGWPPRRRADNLQQVRCDGDDAEGGQLQEVARDRQDYHPEGLEPEAGTRASHSELILVSFFFFFEFFGSDNTLFRVNMLALWSIIIMVLIR
jgi:hypothetical protein